MQHIEDWLKHLGMSEYVERFADSKIDVSVLPYLTDQDLKDRKILAAIAELGIATHPTPEQLRSVEPKLQQDGERRRVTVMFSDLVGSTAMSTRMDPKIYTRLYRPTKSASQRLCAALAASSQSIWAT